MSKAQRVVLDLWPEFQDAAAMRWTSLDQLVRVFFDVPGLTDLSDDDAGQLAAFLTTAIARLTATAPASMPHQPRHFRSAGRGPA
ncbi:hypothetical protein [Azospirillum sp. sgz302134]